MPTSTWDFIADILDLTEVPAKADSVIAPLHGLSGESFWGAYHALTPPTQDLAQGELWLDAYFCGWSPGPDTWRPEVVAPPLAVTPDAPAPSAPVPELSTLAMMTLGLVALTAIHRRITNRGR